MCGTRSETVKAGLEGPEFGKPLLVGGSWVAGSWVRETTLGQALTSFHCPLAVSSRGSGARAISFRGGSPEGEGKGDRERRKELKAPKTRDQTKRFLRIKLNHQDAVGVLYTWPSVCFVGLCFCCGDLQLARRRGGSRHRSLVSSVRNLRRKNNHW